MAAPAVGPARLSSLGPFPLDRPCADRETIRQAAALLAAARRPLIVAGGGVHSSGAAEALARLQEAASLPVVTTSMGKGAVDESHPLSIGIAGYFMGRRGMARHSRDLIAEADVILLVGTRINQNGTDSWKLYPRCCHLHPHRHRRPGDRPQLRGRAAGRRRPRHAATR